MGSLGQMWIVEVLTSVHSLLNIMMIVWCFTSLSTLLKSYGDNEKGHDEMLCAMKCHTVMC